MELQPWRNKYDESVLAATSSRGRLPLSAVCNFFLSESSKGYRFRSSPVAITFVHQLLDRSILRVACSWISLAASSPFLPISWKNISRKRLLLFYWICLMLATAFDPLSTMVFVQQLLDKLILPFSQNRDQFPRYAIFSDLRNLIPILIYFQVFIIFVELLGIYSCK